MQKSHCQVILHIFKHDTFFHGSIKTDTTIMQLLTNVYLQFTLQLIIIYIYATTRKYLTRIRFLHYGYYNENFKWLNNI